MTGRHYGPLVDVGRGRSVLLVAFYRQSIFGQKFVEVAILKPNVARLQWGDYTRGSGFKRGGESLKIYGNIGYFFYEPRGRGWGNDKSLKSFRVP